MAEGFRPAERAVQLADAVRHDPGLSRERLVELLRRHGESSADLTGQAFTAADADELRAAASTIAGVLAETDVDRAAEALNGILAAHATPPYLLRHGGHDWHLHVDHGDDTGWGSWFLASSALALAQLLSERGRPAWGPCAASGCPSLFLDTGPGSPRRYCSSTCATRARVAEHRRRRRTADTG